VKKKINQEFMKENYPCRSVKSVAAVGCFSPGRLDGSVVN